MNPLIAKSRPASSALALAKVSGNPPWLGLVGAAVCVIWLLVALLGPWVAPHPVGEVISDNIFEGFTLAHPFGTDYLGRDMLSRVLVGARFTVGLSLVAALLASTLGTGCALLSVVTPSYRSPAKC
jgi:peptide/nickel transport system permease protein